MKTYLQLEDGSLFEGTAFGYKGKDVVGELTYNTAMVGHQELITDPAYYGQLLVFTYPLIGTYGFNLTDEQSPDIQLKGVICREKIDHPNNFRYEINIDNYLNYHKIPGICGIDTRALSRYLLDHHSFRGIITRKPKTESELKTLLDDMDLSHGVFDVTCEEKISYPGKGKDVAVWDFGLRKSLIDYLKARDCSITQYPAQTSFEKILDANHDLLILSSGPGNPTMVQDIISDIEQILGKIDIVGIGLGAQMLARALGCGIKFLPGHKGSQPIMDLKTKKIYHSHQNYQYGLIDEKPIEPSFINLLDQTTAAFKAKDYRAWGFLFQAEEDPYHGECNFVLDERIGE
ncbi:putative carbamoyl-phosphate synthase, small subunit [Peptoniphilus sp. oral taxon 375 str. F0436]|nr:putative carbamoyl-phosphate synthase, small subunit [Peptoniphilus sp. oral taxon 375 str. F0436]